MVNRQPVCLTVNCLLSQLLALCYCSISIIYCPNLTQATQLLAWRYHGILAVFCQYVIFLLLFFIVHSDMAGCVGVLTVNKKGIINSPCCTLNMWGFCNDLCEECPDCGDFHNKARSHICRSSFSALNQNKPDLLYEMSCAKRLSTVSHADSIENVTQWIQALVYPF